jgi:hypothetical protein
MPMLSSTAAPIRISRVDPCTTFEAICKGDYDERAQSASLPEYSGTDTGSAGGFLTALQGALSYPPATPVRGTVQISRHSGTAIVE